MRIIFHHPLPLDKNAKSASGIRPLRMLEAFKSLGYQVDLVTGYSAERKQCIAEIKQNIHSGEKYDFVYAESSTMPTALTDPHHLPLHPLMDWLFFRFCNQNAIPIGLFYRDIYWRFPDYAKGLNPIKARLAKMAYQFDLWVYQQTLKKLYLPSREMGAYVPWVKPDIFEALPPGHTNPDINIQAHIDRATPELESSQPLQKIKLFYVGGMSEHYQLHQLFYALKDLPEAELTLCTREVEWQSVKHGYPTLSSNIRVIHETGSVMEAELQAADIAILFVKPQEYREFASPVKLYEYLGFCKPILASDGTLAGQFVKEKGIGWSIAYDQTAVRQLLERLIAQPLELNCIRAKLKQVAPEHAWQARAQQVMKGLCQ